MSEKQSSYRQIMKATSLFGGIQIFQIIIQIIRSKAIAILLGPSGMGIMGLLNSTIDIINRATSFGLQTSGVKEISLSNAQARTQSVANSIKVLKRLVWYTGLIGLIITIILSSWLSVITFGNKNYRIAFTWLSITLLLKQLTSGNLAILQGLRKLRKLASANLIGSIFSLLLSLPLFYLLGNKGIVPSIIIFAAVTLVVTWFYSHKIIEPQTIPVNFKNTISKGKEMLLMGLVLSLGGLMSTGAAYILRVFIARLGGIEEVGLYNAGFAIVNTYVGLIFTAMLTDYYPRLSAVANDNIKSQLIINQQAEIAILIIAPSIVIFLIFIDLFIIILYSKQFTPIRGMIYWAALGMFFKSTSWAVGILLVAKGIKKIYFWNELIANFYLLGLNLLGYYLGGLIGLGISFLISYFIYTIQLLIITKVKFGFSYNRKFKIIFLLQLSISFLAFLTTKILNNPYSYLIGSILIIISLSYSIYELNKRLNLKTILLKITKR